MDSGGRPLSLTVNVVTCIEVIHNTPVHCPVIELLIVQRHNEAMANGNDALYKSTFYIALH